MELNHLKYFFVVAREGSFTRASRALRIQQPTISKMVKSLEDQLGFSLLERHKRGIRLTHSGGEVYRICERIFDDVDAINAFSPAEKLERSGPLTFGATDSVASYLVPGILADFLRLYPSVRPSIFSGSSNLICNEIHEGRVEFGLFFTVPESTGFRITRLADVPFRLVIATSQLQNKKRRGSFIISRDIDYPKNRPFPVLEMLRSNGVSVETTIACNNLDAQKELVKQGLGVALLPRFMVKSGLEKGTLTALHSKKEFSYALSLVTRKNRVDSANLTAFREHFEQRIVDLI